MSIEDIRALKHAQPFLPFEIRTRDGQKAVIEEPLRIALSRSGEMVRGFGLEGSFEFFVADIVKLRTRKPKKDKA